MRRRSDPGTALALGAFLVWFAHFMACWVAVEIWPGEARANGLAWAATAVALAALAALSVRWQRGQRGQAARPGGDGSGWGRQLAPGAIALAGAGVVFIAVPSLVFLP